MQRFQQEDAFVLVGRVQKFQVKALVAAMPRGRRPRPPVTGQWFVEPALRRLPRTEHWLIPSGVGNPARADAACRSPGLRVALAAAGRASSASRAHVTHCPNARTARSGVSVRRGTRTAHRMVLRGRHPGNDHPKHAGIAGHLRPFRVLDRPGRERGGRRPGPGRPGSLFRPSQFWPKISSDLFLVSRRKRSVSVSGRGWAVAGRRVGRGPARGSASWVRPGCTWCSGRPRPEVLWPRD